MFYMNEYSFRKGYSSPNVSQPSASNWIPRKRPQIRSESNSLNKIEALLCDIDGTLVESNWLHAAAWKDAFAAMNVHLELEEIRRQIGKGGDQLVPFFVPWWKQPIVQEPLEAYRKFVFQSHYLPKVKPFPQVREFLLAVQQHGIHIALASSASAEDLATYQKIAGIEDLVEKSTSSDDTSRSKPHPDIFTAALKKLGVAAKHTIALGDTPYDAEAAGKAGISTIGVCSGGWTESELLIAGCIEVYKDVADLLEHFESSALTR
jgi:HAD superfamily hydrolase (TIGR01509 family)